MQRSFIFTAERRVHPSRRHHGNATSGVDGSLTYGESRKCFGNFCFKICHSRQLLQGKLTRRREGGKEKDTLQGLSEGDEAEGLDKLINEIKMDFWPYLIYFFKA